MGLSRPGEPEKNDSDFLGELLNIGEMMLSNGAEVKRVEDTLSRLGHAYGAARMDVFVITSSIVVTMGMPDGRSVTQTRRITSAGQTDFSRLDALNALSRRYCLSPFPVSLIRAELERIGQAAPRPSRLFLGGALAAGSLAVFYGGTLPDGLAAACFALLICFLQQRLPRFCNNKVIFNFLCSLLAGAAICLVCRVSPGLHADKIMIGDIMLLIPGLALTNAVRDVLVGDTISGMMRLTEAVLWAGALACGFTLAILATGG